MTDRYENADQLDDRALVELEQELREEFYRKERESIPEGATKPPALAESPELLKAFDRWNRVSTVARKRGLEMEGEGRR